MNITELKPYCELEDDLNSFRRWKDAHHIHSLAAAAERADQLANTMHSLLATQGEEFVMPGTLGRAAANPMEAYQRAEAAIVAARDSERNLAAQLVDLRTAMAFFGVHAS